MIDGLHIRMYLYS